MHVHLYTQNQIFFFEDKKFSKNKIDLFKENEAKQ